MEKISVITICFNAETEIEKTIQSILAQSYSNIEYIIIDGNSKDNTVNIIKKYADRISHWVSEPDKGIYDAMNKGIDLVSGEWIIFMNAGDVFYNDHVLDDIFKQEYSANIAVIYGDVEICFGNAGKLIKSVKRLRLPELLHGICHQASATRASILKQIKYDISYKIMADINSFKEIYNKGYDFVYIPKVFATFQSGGVSSTNSFLLLNESSKIFGVKKISISYLKGYCTALYKYILLKILPYSIYNKIRYKKVSSIQKYKP